MDSGRVQAVLLANSRSNVIYERFYAKYSDIERSSIRDVFQQLTQGLEKAAGEEAEQCSRYRGGAVAVRAEGDVLYYAMGSGEYDELNLSELLRVLANALRALLNKVPSEALLLDNYGQLCLTLDEVIQEGILEATEPEDVRQHMKMQVE